jgi:hypothetical protein
VWARPRAPRWLGRLGLRGSATGPQITSRCSRAAAAAGSAARILSAQAQAQRLDRIGRRRPALRRRRPAARARARSARRPRRGRRHQQRRVFRRRRKRLWRRA